MEVAGLDEVAGAADVEHDRDAGLLGAGPDADRGAMWLRGVASAGSPEATRSGGGAHGDRLVGERRRPLEVEERHVAGGQQPGVGRAELDHAAVVGPGRADGELGVAAVLPVAEPAVVERVEDELAREPEEVEGPAPVLGEERAGGGEVLAAHDLGLLDGAVLVGAVLGGEPVERGDEVAQLLVDVAGLPQLVAAGVAQRLDAVADAPGRRGRAATSGVSMMWASASCTTRPDTYGIVVPL